MAFKFIILSALVATVANAGLLPTLNYQTSHLSHSPLNQHKVVLINDIHGSGGDDDDYHHAPAHYAFSYDVHDPHTGDIKSQKEVREGDVVKGEYSLVEPDGHIRTVKYAADKHSGFNAVVHREAIAHHQQPIAVKTISAPVLSYHSSPIQSYSSPIQSYSSHGPALSYSHGY